MILSFEKWLTNQQLREDRIGNLARDLKMQNIELKPSKHRLDEHKNWADIVIGMAETRHIAVFNEAWQEFLLAKQVAQDSLE